MVAMILSRRELLQAGVSAATLAVGGPVPAGMRTRPIPRSGEELPVIGMGTWRTFDTAERAALVEVARTLFGAGGRVIDSSPMYGRSETTVGAVLESIVRAEKPDFVQLPYSVGVREAEQRLLPACGSQGVAVLVMRPFEGGSLFSDARKRPLPGWAAEIDCTTWAQIFLKFILGHPAVTCPIPATSNPAHMADDVRAGFGRVPDEAMRRRIVKELLG